MNICRVIICLTVLLASHAWAAPPAGYIKVWEDTFDSGSLDTNNWTVGLKDPGTGHLMPGAAGQYLLNTSYSGYITGEDVAVSNGVLYLQNQKRSYTGTAPGGSYQYTSGWIMSMHKVYLNKGYIEFKAKFPSGDKVWPALWLIAEDRVWGPEWDMWEYFGWRSDVGYDNMGMHLCYDTYPNQKWSSGWIGTFDQGYDCEAWHVYGFEWTTNKAVWTVDGVVRRTLNRSALGGNQGLWPDEDMYLVLNNGVQAAAADTTTTWPNNVVIDYVAIYSDKSPFVDPKTPANAMPVSGGTGWKLMFSDEFNTNSLDTSKWGIDVSASSRSSRLERGISDWWWKAENVSLDGSNVVLAVVKHDSNTMYCGSISSDGIYEPTYGYMEARVQIADTRKDTHTAFWMQSPTMGTVDGTAYDGAEIDIFESPYTNDTATTTVHIDGYGTDHRATGGSFSAPGLHSGFHVFGLEWNATSMKVYYDGVLKRTFTGTWVSQTNQYLWLSDGASFYDIGTFTNEPIGFLTSAKFDYVRAWQSASNAAPVFSSDPMVKPSAVEYLAYSNSIAGSATDDEGDAITYSKVSGPSWLTVSGSGALTGTPVYSDIGTNSWTVRAQDVNGGADTAVLTIVVYAAGAGITIVGGDLLNGNFNAVTGTAVTFSATPEWDNLTGDQAQNATRSDESFDGSQNAVVLSSRRHGLDTGYGIVEGDTFNISYVWRDSGGWTDTVDQITYSLFVTSDDTITGARSNLVVHPSGLSAVNDSYEQVAASGVYTAAASVAGKRLFIAIETTASGFARVDNVVLSVIPEPACIIVTSTNAMSVTEGSTGNFSVRLYANPLNTTTVNVANVSGDSDLSVSAGSQLLFTPANGTNWQQVTVSAAQDADWSNGSSVIRCSDAGGAAASVNVNASEIDNDNVPPAVDAGTNQTVVITEGALWTPAQASVVAWYDAADAASIAQSGGLVSQWSDKSGHEYHVTQTNSTMKPTTGTRTIKGINVLDFDGGDDLAIASRLGLPANPDMMVFVVHVADSAAGRLCKVGDSGNYGLGPSTYQGFSWRYDGNYEKYGSAAMGTPYNSCYWRPAGGDCASARFFDSGTEQSATTVGSTAKPTNTAAEFRIGNGKNSGGDAFMNGAIGELIIVQSTNVVLQQMMEGYLAHKWGMATNLPPSGHPYRVAPPGGASATATLDGTVSDLNGDTLDTLWTVTAGPAGTIFGDALALDTTATFAYPGIYTLRLTANDGLAQSYSDVTITVSTNVGATCSLSVISAYGSPSPSGNTTPASNSTVNAYIGGSPVTLGSTRYVATGWIGTGSATSGTGTNTSFTITQDSTITWLWQTNYFITFGVEGE
jgi:beta-glucanase (GH16 family)